MHDAKRVKQLVLLLCATTLALAPAHAHACGVSGPDGVWSCSLEEHEEQERPRWNLGAVGAYTWTKIRIASVKAKAERSAALVSASYAPSKRLRFQASAGVAISGSLAMPDGKHEFSPGVSGALGVNYRFLTGKPFLLLSGVVSASTAETHLRGDASDTERYTALDLRVALAFGATFFEALSPYVVTRVFGGPIFWRYQGKDVTGTDNYHVQLGAGLAYRIARRVDVFVEGVPLGERAISGGAAAAF
jgi:hypothetical protein